MRRRAFIAGLGGAAAWPLMARGQQVQSQILRLGLISGGNPRQGPPWEAFDARLRELGYVEGQNLVTVFFNLEARPERALIVAQELVQSNLDIVVASGPDFALKAALATSGTRPIVMIAIDYDPLALGYVTNLARPSNNITGLFLRQPEQAAKRIQLLKQAFPEQHAAIVFFDGVGSDQWQATRAAAETMQLQLAGVEFKEQPYDYDRGLAQVPPEHRSVAIALMSPIIFRDRSRFADFALRHRLATVVTTRDQVTAGCLMSFGPDISGMLRRAADYVDRIAKGARPSDIPIEQPTTFEMVVNLKTAKAIGVELPTALLLRADEVIE